VIVSVSSDNIRRTTDSLNQAAKKPLCSSLWTFGRDSFNPLQKLSSRMCLSVSLCGTASDGQQISQVVRGELPLKQERRGRSAAVATLGGLLAAMSQVSGELQSSSFNGFPDQLEPVWSDA
jgi:hypothetical protein